MTNGRAVGGHCSEIVITNNQKIVIYDFGNGFKEKREMKERLWKTYDYKNYRFDNKPNQ